MAKAKPKKPAKPDPIQMAIAATNGRIDKLEDTITNNCQILGSRGVKQAHQIKALEEAICPKVASRLEKLEKDRVNAPVLDQTLNMILDRVGKIENTVNFYNLEKVRSDLFTIVKRLESLERPAASKSDPTRAGYEKIPGTPEHFDAAMKEQASRRGGGLAGLIKDLKQDMSYYSLGAETPEMTRLRRIEQAARAVAEVHPSTWGLAIHELIKVLHSK